MPKPKKQNPRTEAGACVDLAGGLEATNQRTQPESTTDSELPKSKSAATKVQVAKVWELLRQGPKTTIELRHHAIMMPAARVFQLKREHGCTVTTELIALYDDQGVRHSNCARYHLIELPAVQAAFDFGGAP